MQMFRILCLTVAILVAFSNGQNNTTFQVGIILDADSLVGRIGLTSLSLSLSNFYTENSNYSTRLVLHVRDSRGQLTGAAASALNLLKDVEVDAIIGPQTSAQANFVMGLGDTAQVPVISFSATSPSLHSQTPYFVQTAVNDAAQVDAIAAVFNYFQWHQVVFIYEDSSYGKDIIPYLSNAFQQVNARVSYRSVIPASASDDFILRELYKMKTMQTRVFVVHTSFALASKFFLKVKEADMMGEGYAWIITSGVMDLFHSLESRVVSSMQGVVGVKPLIPESKEVRSTSQKWKEKFLLDNPSMSQAEISAYGVWAYDTLWALAMAAERVGFRESSSLQNTSNASNSTNMFITGTSLTGPKLHDAMLRTQFQGLGGNFRLVNGQLEPPPFQIVNVAGNRLKEVGLWTPSTSSDAMSFSGERLKGVIWPGESTSAPKGWEIPVSGKRLRVGVPEKASFPEFVNVQRDPQTNASKITGYYIDLFNSVMDALPYAVRYDFVPFDIMGDYDNLAYQVLTGTLDAAVGDITLTAKRSQYVDFSLPIEDGGINIIQKKQYYEDPNNWDFFLKPFSKELWLTAIAILIYTGLALWIIEHRLNEYFRGLPSEHIGLIFYIPLMSLVFANREKIVSNYSRIVVVFWILTVMVLASSYTASLSATLTAQRLAKLDDVSTLVKNGFNVGCREGSFVCSQLINTHKFDKTKVKEYNSTEVCDDDLSKGAIKAMFATTPYTRLFLSKYCKYRKYVLPDLSEGFAFVFPKGSPLVADVSRSIVQLTDSGSITTIKGRWFSVSCSKDGVQESDDADQKSTGITLKSFKILFAITGGVTTTCLIAFLATYLYQNRDFVQRISNSGTTTWSKIRAVSRHFDQRDPKSFRSGGRGNYEEGDPTASPSPTTHQHHRSAVVPNSCEDSSIEIQVVGPNSDNSTAAAAANVNK